MASSPTKIQVYFKDYATFHKTPGNQATHMIGIPLIVLSVLGALGHLPVGDGLTGSELFRVDAGSIAWALSMLFYFSLDWRLAIPQSLFTAGLYFAGRSIPVPLNAAIFVLGWIFQYIGHYRYEKKSPAFYKNGEHLLIGPFWVLAKVLGYNLAPPTVRTGK